MFTGIIKSLGKVGKITVEPNMSVFELQMDPVLKLEIGASVAVNGVCLTVESFDADSCQFSVVKETLSITNLSELSVGDYVNLEPSLRANDPIDGHIVQGHVDCMARFIDFVDGYLSVAVPLAFSKFIAKKGSITLNGVSLTVTSITDNDSDSVVNVALIPHTIQNTNFLKIPKNSHINVEVDVLSRYLDRLIQTKNG